MQSWVYLVIGIAFFLVLISFTHVNLVVIYNNGLKVYYRVLFVKVRVFPFPSSKKKKTNDGGVSEIKKTFDQITRYKELTKTIFGFYFRALHFKVINLDILISSKEPSSTALLFSSVMQLVTYLAEYIQKNTKLEFSKEAIVSVKADFLGKTSHFKSHFVLYTYLGPLMAVGIFAFFKMLISFIWRLLNGTIKAKRAN